LSGTAVSCARAPADASSVTAMNNVPADFII
jgi:hypothetical protein